MTFSAHQKHYQTLPISFSGQDGDTAAPPPTPSSMQPSCLRKLFLDCSIVFHPLFPFLLVSPHLQQQLLQSRFLQSPNNSNFLNDFLSPSSSHLGFFQLTQLQIPSKLAISAELKSLSLLCDLPLHGKATALLQHMAPLMITTKNLKTVEEKVLVIHRHSASMSILLVLVQSQLKNLYPASLMELSKAMEKVGFKNPINNKNKEMMNRSSKLHCPLVWVPVVISLIYRGRFYPYVMALQYQIRCGQKYSLLADYGWVSMSPLIESVLVTLGDIAQVWSNGRLKKVRGRPVPIPVDGESRTLHINVFVAYSS